MPKIALTDRFCATAKPLNGRVDYFDTAVRGLALRVTETEHRSWCFHYRSPRDGRRARATIGTYPATSLAAARGQALEARAHVEAGRDPRTALAGQATAGMIVANLVTAYIVDPKRAALRSKREIERRLRRNVIPVIGEVKLDELRRRDVRNVTDQIMRRGRKIEANRTFSDLKSMIRWAVEHEYLDANPIDGMAKPAEEASRDRVLNDDEIRTLWSRLPEALPRSVERIVKLCLVTAQRVGEVAGLVPAELDFTAREWRLPGLRTKNEFAHIVPLSDLAIRILKEVMADAGKGPLFPWNGNSVSSKLVAQAILRGNQAGRFGIAKWTAHDLRRTALTGMARLGVAPIVLGHVANHRSTTRAGVTLAVYSQYAYDKEKRQAVDLWADRLSALTGAGATAVVLPIGRRPA
jgi:integrase